MSDMKVVIIELAAIFAVLSIGVSRMDMWIFSLGDLMRELRDYVRDRKKEEEAAMNQP
jgi:Sec-independent protein translocase protein TatA